MTGVLDLHMAVCPASDMSAPTPIYPCLLAFMFWLSGHLQYTNNRKRKILLLPVCLSHLCGLVLPRICWLKSRGWRGGPWRQQTSARPGRSWGRVWQPPEQPWSAMTSEGSPVWFDLCWAYTIGQYFKARWPSYMDISSMSLGGQACHLASSINLHMWTESSRAGVSMGEGGGVRGEGISCLLWWFLRT